MLTATLQSVLDEALRGHEYVSDREQYQRSEYWVEGLHGDCEDFALWCRRRLREYGIAAQLVHCITERGEHHLVCEVQGNILDNRSRWVKPRDQVDYVWIAMSGPDGKWYKIVSD